MLDALAGSRPRRCDNRRMTTVHLVRHGEVHNPEGVLYGRLPELPPLRPRPGDGRAGRRPPGRTRDIAAVISSPMERAQETVGADRPAARPRGQPGRRPDRGRQLLPGHGLRRRRRLAAPPPALAAAGQPVPAQLGRAVRRGRRPDDARRHGRPGRSPARPARAARSSSSRTSCRSGSPGCTSSTAGSGTTRASGECSLCSITSLTYDGDRLTALSYAEPAAALLPGAGTRGGRVKRTPAARSLAVAALAGLLLRGLLGRLRPDATGRQRAATRSSGSPRATAARR